MTRQLKNTDDLRKLSDTDLYKALNDIVTDYGVGAVPIFERLADSGDHRVSLAACNALGEIHDVSAANALFKIKESSKNKDLRKQAGRALHRLSSIKIEPEKEEEPAKDTPGFTSVGKIEKAYTTYYDPTGVRLLIMGVRPPGRPLFRVIWTISHKTGIHDSFIARLSKHEFKEWIYGLRQEKEGIFEIDPIHSRYIASEAYEITVNKGGTLPDGIGVYLETIKNMSGLPSGPIIYRLPDAEEIKPDPVALGMSDLSDLAECKWHLNEEITRDYAGQASDVMKSVIVISEIVRNERLQKIVDDFITNEFSSGMADIYRRMLEETAYLFVLDKRLEHARLALSVASRLKLEKTFNTIPFIRRLAERSIGIFRADSREGKEIQKHMAEEERTRLIKPASTGKTGGMFHGIQRG